MLKREELVERLVKEGYTKKDAAIILDGFIKVVSDALIEGESVQLHGFGTFSVKEYAERETVDYQTRERIIVPAYRAPKFVAGKLLKRSIKEGFVRV